MDHRALEQIIARLNEELDLLKSRNQNPLIQTETAAGICQVALDEIRKLVINYDFDSEEEEIYFYKFIKPMVLSKYIYFVKLLEIESHRFNASVKFQIKYMNHYLKELQKYLDVNVQFCQYYWGNKTNLDKLYFLRKNSKSQISVNNICIQIDHQNSTSMDSTAAGILAYEQLIKYVENEICFLKFGCREERNNAISKAIWTGSIVSCVELIYALQSSGVINNGNIELKELVEIFESMFNVKLEEFYRVYSDIQMRKKNRTKFLDELKAALIRRIESADL